LSDGQTIECSATEIRDISTMFDTTKDKQCSKGYKTRYIIYYNNSDTNISIEIPKNAIYVIFSGVKFNTSPFSSKTYLQAVKCINNTQYNNTSANSMFNGCYMLQNVINLDTSNVTKMEDMFNDCYSLQNVMNLDTSNVTSMNSMFRGCYTLKNVSKLDTNNVINMGNMFNNCYTLQRIPNLDTNKVTNMSNMYNNCKSLHNITNLDTSSATNVNTIFANCYALINIDNISNISISLTVSSSRLNHKTLVKILNALVDLTETTSQKLTLNSTNLAKLTDEEKAIAIEKNWTLA